MSVDAEPYPWPYDGAVTASRVALVVAGNQAAWADRSQGRTDVVMTIGRVAQAMRSIGATVVHVRHGVTTEGRCGLPPARRSSSWDLHVPPASTDVIVDAGGVCGFYAGDLDDVLRARGIDQLILTGFGAEAAVDSTLRAANDRGYECLTLTDACAPFDPSTGRAALSSITMSGGIFGAIATSAALLAALPILEVTS